MSINVILPESLTIHQIDQNYTNLLEQFTTSDETIIIDGEAVESIDTSGLQSLIVLINHAQAANNTIEWNAPSDILSQSAKKLNLSEALLLD